MVMRKNNPKYLETRLRKPCKGTKANNHTCGKPFRPTSKYSVVCNDCLQESEEMKFSKKLEGGVK